MTDMATNPVVYSRKPMQSINRKILTILQVPFSIPQAVRATLQSAAEAFVAKSFKSSAKYLKDALESMSNKDEKSQAETIVLTKYMLCMCWLESTDAKDLMDALKILEELERNYGYAYPMLYYAVGKAYFKLYRFAKADEILKKGFSILNGDAEVIEYKIPGTDVPIPESFRDRLVAALVSLNDQCSSWHRPDAVCCMPDCSTHSQNESADKNIFFGSPTFIGMVQVSCNHTSNTCTVTFHAACWKAKKENLSSLRKLSDKDLLHWECFTPNCEDQGVRCTIKKIEIFDENAKVKSSMTYADEVVKHTKVQSQLPKGAIRKQQQQQTPKVKTANESRTPAERHPRPPHIPNEGHKTDETEDYDDLHDEQAIRSGVEQLVGLRASNFGIEDEKIWRPNLSLYGNEFMLATADALPDPDFSDEGPEEAELKAFFFSYFYTFISKSGPVKLEVLTEKWNEAKNLIDKNCDSILNHYTDITEFLLQSVKFAVIGGYICVAEKLPETYDLAKSDACDTLRFFVENDIDQRSDSSSIDDDAFFNDIVNQEKNNNSLPYSSISVDSKTGTDDVNVALDGFADTKKKTSEPFVDGLNTSKVGQPLQYATSNRKKNKNTTAVNDHTMGFMSSAAKSVTPHEDAEKKKEKPIIPNQPELPVEKVSTPVKKPSQKRAHSVEHVNGEVSNCIEKKMPVATKEIGKSADSLLKAINGVDHVHEISSHRNVASKPKVLAEKLTKESKSVNDMVTHGASSMKDHGPLMCNSGEPDERPNSTIPPSRTSENGLTNSETPLEAKNEEKETLVGELLEEVQRLSSKLSVSEDRTVQLESEVSQIKKEHANERVKLLKKNLQGQYAYNYSLIVRRLDECRKNCEIISLIQGILMNSTGRTLPTNITEQHGQTVIAEIEKVLKKQQTKFWELHDKLERATEQENISGIDLPLDPMPNMPTIDLPEAIQVAFGLYESYVMNEIQRAMQFPQNPMMRYPHMIGGPQFRQRFGHYNPGMVYPPNCMPNRPPQLNVRMPQPPYAPLPMHIDHVIPPRPSAVQSPVQQKLPNPSESQIPPMLLQQTNSFSFGSTSSPAPMQRSVSSPVHQRPTGSANPSFSTLDASKVPQQSPKISDPEHVKINPVQQQGWQYFGEPGFAGSRQGNVQDSEKSYVKVHAERSHAANDQSSANSTPSPVSSAFGEYPHKQVDMPAALNVTSHDKQAKPKEAKPRKKNYHSIDKLVEALRSRHLGVLELDLIKSVETVRKNHRNSLTGIPMGQIIREAERIIMDRQQRQLCGYEKRPSPFSAATNSSPWSFAEGERKRENSMSSTSSAYSAKKEPQGSTASKKKWEPVVIPNDTWQKETPESECPICLQPMLHTAEHSYTLQCKHTFHKECIKNWHEHNKSCPTCRVHSTIDDEYPPLPLG